MAARHLHKDYHAAFCGKDASHIPMTFDVADATCKTCVKRGTEYNAAVEAEAKARAEAEAFHEKHREKLRATLEQADKLRADAAHRRLDEMLAKVGHPRAPAS